MNSSLPEDYLCKLIYRKADVDDFKLNHKELWEALQKQKRGAIDTRTQDEILEGNNAPSIPDYIERRRNEGAKVEIIAFELRERFKLTYKRIALLLIKDNAYVGNAAWKMRGLRLVENGKKMIKS